MADKVKEAVDGLLKDPIVPLGEKDGSLRFFSEKLNDVEQERAQLVPRTPDVRRVFNEALNEVFEPLPSVRLHGSLSVTSGLKHLSRRPAGFARRRAGDDPDRRVVRRPGRLRGGKGAPHRRIPPQVVREHHLPAGPAVA